MPKALAKYKQKRKFDKTPEPQGKIARSAEKSAPVFVIQKHQASRLHYDFRLEHKGILLSWAVPKGPSTNPFDKRLAMMVEDHPFEYRKFEGTIPEGNYGAGTVMIWDQGNYLALNARSRSESEKIIAAGLHKGHLTFILNGSKLRGEFALIRLRRGGENAWLLVKADDQYASKKDVTKQDLSAQSGKSMQAIAAGSKIWQSNRTARTTANSGRTATKSRDRSSTPEFDLSKAPKSKMPRVIAPMLAKLVSEPFDDPDWIFEIKWDGFRAVAEIAKNKVELYSRNQQSFNEEFAPVLKTLRKIKDQMVLDGEIVVVDRQGRSHFQLLQNYRSLGQGADKLVYYVFDILYLNGRDLRGLPLIERKKILTANLPKLPNIKYSGHIERDGKTFFKAAREKGLEGIIAKEKISPYRPGKRSGEWLKIKTHQRQEAVIGGFTEPRGSRKEFGALVLGVYERGKLAYIGHTGGGFNQQSLKQTYRLMRPLISKEQPFKQQPKTNAPATWIKPLLIAEIEFSGWTADGRMRQPIFIGIRKDKDPKDVRREIPESTGKIISNR